MAHVYRGTNGDVAEMRTDALSGGLSADQYATTINGVKTPGNVAIWDAFGNVVDSGVSLASLIGSAGILEDSFSAPVITSESDLIYG